MANSLLDFVMSLVRDPDAAAAYAADPSQAIADAHLTDVSSVDVSNLIPVVSESLSMASPAVGSDAPADGNVWASGAATSAFDAFADHVPADTLADAHHITDGVIDQPLDQTVHYGLDHLGASGPDALPTELGGLDTSPQFDSPVIDDPAPADPTFALDDSHGLEHPQPDDHTDHGDPGGFDIFS